MTNSFRIWPLWKRTGFIHFKMTIPEKNKQPSSKFDVDSSFEPCQFCGNPVPPIAELDLGTHIQIFMDTNPICEDCMENGFVPQKRELRF